MSDIIAIDVGGTKIKAIAYNYALEPTTELHEQTESHFSEVYKQILRMISELQTTDTKAIGIGVPGLLYQPEGTIHTLPNIKGAEKFELKKQLEADTGLPCAVDNDANCFALGEALFGAGKDCPVVVGITMGTGIGGGIVLNGKVFHGGNGFGAEVGHMLLQPGQPPYETDDKRGEVEQFFSGSAMKLRCSAAKDPKDYLEGEVCSFMHKDIYREISWFLVNIIHLLDPNVVIIGGSAGHSVAKHFDELHKELEQWMLPGTPLPKICLESVPQAANLGAASLAKELL